MDKNRELLPFPSIMEDNISETQRVQDVIKKNDEIQESVSKATWINTKGTDVTEWSIGDKWLAFSDTFDDTWAGQIYDYVKYDAGAFQEEDKSFTDAWDDIAITETMKQAKLPARYYQKLSGAKNPKHKESLLQFAIKDNERQKHINRSLDSYGGGISERALSSVATGLVDIDMPIAMLGAGFTKLTGLRKIAMAGAVGTHATVASVVHGISDGEVSSSEAVLFGLIGMSADAFAISRYGKTTGRNVSDEIAEGISPDAPSNQQLGDMVDNHSKQAKLKSELKAKQKEAVEDEKLLKKDIKTIEKLEAELKDMPAGVKRTSMESELMEARGRVEHLRRKQLEKDRFKAYKEKQRLQKESEAKQKEIDLEQKKLDEIDARTAKFRDRLKELKDKKQEPPRTKRKDAKDRLEEESRLESEELRVETKKRIDKLIAEKAKVDKQVDEVSGIAEAQEKLEIRKKMNAKERLEQTRLEDELASIEELELNLKKKRDSINRLKDERKRSDRIKEIETESKSLNKRMSQVNRDMLRNEYKAKESMVVESNFNKFIDRVNAIEAKVKAEKKGREFSDKNWKVKRLIDIQRTLSDMGQDLAMNIAEWKRTIREAIDNGDSATLKDIENIVDEVYNKGYMSKGDYQKYKNQMSNGRYEGFKIKGKLNKDGKIELVGVKGKGKSKLAVGSVMALGLATSINADDGSVEVSGLGGYILGAIALGIAWKSRASINSGIADMYKRIRHSERTAPLMEKVENTIDSLRTSATETFAPLMRDGNKEFTDFVKKILWDSENGEALTVERNKASIFHSLSARLQRGLDLDYQDYIKEVGMNRATAALKNLSVTENSARLEFEIKVMEYIESGKHADSKAIVHAGEGIKDMHKEIRQIMIDAGVKVADKMLDLGESYMPRFVRSKEIRTLVMSLDDINYRKFISNFAKMMDGDIAKAEAYIQTAMAHSQSQRRITKIEEVEEFLKKNNITDISADEVADIFGVSQSVTGRTKARARLNKDMFEDFTVVVDNKTVDVNLNKLFVNNAVEAMERHFNSISGHIALADVGFKSIDEAFEFAEKAKNTENIDVMTDVIKILIGEPIMNVNSKSAKMIQTASNLTVALKMPFSVMSLTQEAFNTIVKSRGGAFKTFAEEIKNVFLKHGESSAIVDELTDFMGQGQHRHSASYGSYSHISDGIDNMVTASSGLHKLSEIGRDTVLYNLGLVPVSDFLTRINLVDSASYLHDIVNGTQKMPDYMKKIIGLTPDIEQMLKGKLIKKNGELQKLGVKDWDRVDQLAFKKVVDNMMQKRIQMATVGGTPHWGRSDKLGVVLSGLLKFPLQAFSNHGIVDLKGSLIHKDPRAMAAMMAWFAGGYIASMMRNEVKGRDYDDDDLIASAMLSMPLLGAPYGIYSTFTNGSAMQSAMSDISMGLIETGRMVTSE